MTRLVNIVTISAILVWTLLSLGAWAAVSVSGDLLQAIAGWTASDAPAVAWIFLFLQGVGFGVVAVVWALGTATLGFLSVVGRRLARSVELGPYAGARAWEDRYEPDPRAMKDVTPPRQTERPALPRR
jgi:hypothetical protein